jgi:hypothetical protein
MWRAPPTTTATLAAALLASACGSSAGAGGPDGGGDATGADAGSSCPGFAPLEVTGVIEHGAFELSGIAASVDTPGVLWVHNDDAGPALLYAVDPAGVRLATVAIDATVADFEDLARVGRAGADALYLADVGDNDRSRTTIRVLRIAEPAVDLADRDASIQVHAVDVFTLRYAGGAAHDAEAIAIEPATGDLYVFTKAHADDPVSRVFRAAAFDRLVAPPADPIELDFVLDESNAPGLTGSIVTAALSPADDRLLLGFREGPFRLWPRIGALPDTLAATPCGAPRAAGQVEGATFAAGGDGYYMTEEGVDPRVVRATFVNPREDR